MARAATSDEAIVDTDSLEHAAGDLAASDPSLARLLERNGVPPLWRRPEGFATLVLLILEQQVSLASARAAYRRLEVTTGGVTPTAFLALDQPTLSAIGFSRQKSSYGRDLAMAIEQGTFRPSELGSLPDAEATEHLLRQRGIGPWTAACYLLGALGRIDAWPTGDRALLVSMGNVLDMGRPPSRDEADAIAERWRPRRSVAARMLWHDYLAGAPEVPRRVR